MVKGLRVIRGYVQVRLFHKGKCYQKHFGPDSPLAREYALKHLLEKRHEIRMGKFGVEKELPSKKFKEVVPIYMKFWREEKDGDGRLKHSESSINERQRVFDRNLTPFFGPMSFESIRTIEVEKWREGRLATGVLGTSVNREMVPLGDMFTEMTKAVAVERINAFKLPAQNPCTHATKAEMRVRERILTDYELRKLHLAFTTLNDADGWEIVLLALQSVLSPKDLRKLEIGATIDIKRSKSNVPVNIPITILQRLNWTNWRRRWEAARKEAGLEDVQFGRDLRKTGGNEAVGHFDLKLVSQYFGHSTIKTTEKSYTMVNREKMRPIAEHLQKWVTNL